MNSRSFLPVLLALAGIVSSPAGAADAPASATPASALTITFPPTRIVLQRGLDRSAPVPVRGQCAAGVTRVEARLVPRVNGQGMATDWTVVDAAPAKGQFRGTLPGAGGWYNLEVRGWAGSATAGTVSRERVGVGEVFIIVGHSVAHGQDINLDGATDDRVMTVPMGGKGSEAKPYVFTGKPEDLPEANFVPFEKGVYPAPFGNGTYFWSDFGQLVARRENVPVLIYNAAFGGTSLEHWGKSAQGIFFEHTFVKAAIRMPYINLRHTLTKYIPLTGVRAVLADQGQNDWPEKKADVVFGYYDAWVKQARADLGHPALAIVVNRQTPFLRDKAIRQAQERMIASPHCFTGPDYDRLAAEDRPDAIHLGQSGAIKAAQMWAEALDGEFFRKAQPWMPEWK